MANAPYYRAPAYLYGLPSADTLRIDDLLDFSNSDLFPAAADGYSLQNQPDSVSLGGGGAGSSYYPHSSTSSFADDIYVPSDEAAELEWLSKFVEDSFSDVPYLSATAPIRAESVPNPAIVGSSSTTSRKRNGDGGDGRVGVDESGVRRCTHCAAEKTPQWRAGPQGPKTLCNACGVRFKSGRLVPEYRPAASPTFVLTQHSNSHRKVVELRRQKEAQHHHNSSSSSSSRLDLIRS